MKKYLFGVFISLVLLTGCGSDPVQEELLDYINTDMSALADKEATAIDAYEKATGENYTDDQTLYNELTNVIIPTYKEFVEQLEEVKVESDELKELHEMYVEAANTQYNAFLKIVDAIEKGDTGIISEANEMLSEARNQLRTYQSELEKLAKEHDVEINSNNE